MRQRDLSHILSHLLSHVCRMFVALLIICSEIQEKYRDNIYTVMSIFEPFQDHMTS